MGPSTEVMASAISAFMFATCAASYRWGMPRRTTVVVNASAMAALVGGTLAIAATEPTVTATPVPHTSTSVPVAVAPDATTPTTPRTRPDVITQPS